MSPSLLCVWREARHIASINNYYLPARPPRVSGCWLPALANCQSNTARNVAYFCHDDYVVIRDYATGKSIVICAPDRQDDSHRGRE